MLKGNRMKQISPKLKSIFSWILTFVVALMIVLAVNVIVSSCRRQDLIEMEIDFTVKDAQGKEVSLSDFAGKPVVVNFWATWCPPCKAELPDFQEAYDEYGDEVEFLFIDVIHWRNETVEEVQAFMEQNGYDFPVYYDTERDAESVCGVDSIPFSIFIGRDGKIAHTYLGAIPSFKLNQNIQSILK